MVGGTWMGKTLMIIILPIRLDGVGFLLRHEKVFQTPNVPARNSIFFFCQFTFKATRPPPYSYWMLLEQWVVWTGSSHWGGVGGAGRKPETGIIYIYINIYSRV